MINSVNLVGHLASDPKLCGNDRNVLRFTLAVNERIDAEREHTNFFDCVVFGEKRASALHGILKRGMKIAVSGALRWSSYDSNGEIKYSVDVVAKEIELPPKSE